MKVQVSANSLVGSLFPGGVGYMPRIPVKTQSIDGNELWLVHTKPSFLARRRRSAEEGSYWVLARYVTASSIYNVRESA